MESGSDKTTLRSSMSTSPPVTYQTFSSSSLSMKNSFTSALSYSNSSAGMGSAGGSVSSTSKIPSINSRVPSPVTAVIGNFLYLRHFLRNSFMFSSAPQISHLLSATICGSEASFSLYCLSSALICLKSSYGSRPSIPEMSTTCTSIRVRSMWRRKS